MTEAIRVAVRSLRAVAVALETALDRFETLGSAPVAASPAPAASEASESHWDLISEVQQDRVEAAPSGNNDAYQRVADRLTPVPPACLELCRALGDSASSRAKRAWEAGLWARAAVDGQVPTVRPSPKLDLRNTVYIILQAPGLTEPVRAHSAGVYFQILPSFKGSRSVSHGFASLAEAQVYCAAFGIVLPPERK